MSVLFIQLPSTELVVLLRQLDPKSNQKNSYECTFYCIPIDRVRNLLPSLSSLGVRFRENEVHVNSQKLTLCNLIVMDVDWPGHNDDRGREGTFICIFFVCFFDTWQCTLTVKSYI